MIEEINPGTGKFATLGIDKFELNDQKIGDHLKQEESISRIELLTDVSISDLT
jgi:hypothetical protein